MTQIKQGGALRTASFLGLLSLAAIAFAGEAQAGCYRLNHHWFCRPAPGFYQPSGSSAYLPYERENSFAASREYPGKYTGFPPPGDISYPGPRPNSAGGS